MKYRVYKDEKLTDTPLMKNTLKPNIKHSKVFTFGKVTKEHLEFFESGCITFLVYGTQEDATPDPKLLKYSTRVSIFFGNFYISSVIFLLNMLKFWRESISHGQPKVFNEIC